VTPPSPPLPPPRKEVSNGYVGANFIHGTQGNPLADIAKKVGSTFVSYREDSRQYYYDGSGNLVDEETGDLMHTKVWTYYEAASDYSRKNVVDKDADVRGFFEEQLQKDEEVKDEILKGLVSSAIDMLNGISACDLDKLSLKYYWMEDDLPVPSPPLP